MGNQLANGSSYSSMNEYLVDLAGITPSSQSQFNLENMLAVQFVPAGASASIISYFNGQV
jgi:hypothetical protein